MRSSILNEEIMRNSSGKGSGSAYNIRGRYDNKNTNVRQRHRSMSRGKGKQQDITCYQCGHKGHKKLDGRLYNMELERKKDAGEKKNKDDLFDAVEKANMASNVIIEDLSGEDGDVFCIIGDTFIAHVQAMQITKTYVIDALLSIDDGLTQTWIVDSRVSFHVTPCLECFTIFDAVNYGKVYLGNNNPCNFDGIDTIHLCLDNGQELVLSDVRQVCTWHYEKFAICGTNGFA